MQLKREMMRRFTAMACVQLLLLTALLLAGGCNRRAAVMRVSIKCPGKSATVLDAQVAAPGAVRLFTNGGVQAVSAVSRAGQTDFYVTASRQTDAAQFRAQIERALSAFKPELPAGTAAPQVTLLPAGQEPPIPADPQKEHAIVRHYPARAD